MCIYLIEHDSQKKKTKLFWWNWFSSICCFVFLYWQSYQLKIWTFFFEHWQVKKGEQLNDSFVFNKKRTFFNLLHELKFFLELVIWCSHIFIWHSTNIRIFVDVYVIYSFFLDRWTLTMNSLRNSLNNMSSLSSSKWFLLGNLTY